MHKHTPSLVDACSFLPVRGKKIKALNLRIFFSHNYDTIVAIKMRQSKDAKGCHTGSEDLISKDSIKTITIGVRRSFQDSVYREKNSDKWFELM